MTQIDYKAEVLKAYPDAWCRLSFGKYTIYRNHNWLDPVLSIGFHLSEQDAWQSAYERLKSECKLHK